MAVSCRPIFSPRLVSNEFPASTAPHWIHSLITSKFRDTAEVLPPAARARMFERGGDHHHHCLILIGPQSTLTERPSSILHCLCLWCDYHFLITTKYQEEHADGLCNFKGIPSDNKLGLPLHHLQFVPSGLSENVCTPMTPYHSLVATSQFVCSAPSCTFEVILEISEPRLRQDFRDMLQDSGRVRANLERARTLDPERFKIADSSWEHHAPSVLNTYLKSLLDGTIRDISKANKKFSVTLGPECSPILHALEFKEEKLVKDGVEIDCFVPTPLPLAASTTVTAQGSRRAFIEDFRAEVENIIFRSRNASDCKPAYTYEHLERNLGCYNFPRTTAINKPIYPFLHIRKIEEEKPEFNTLGALRCFPNPLIRYAYLRQCTVWHSHQKELLTALHLVATAYPEHEDLGEFWAMEESALQPEIARPLSGPANLALSYFGVPDLSLATADYMSALFFNKIVSNPEQTDFAREMMAQFGQDRQMADLVALSKARLPVDVARKILSLGPDADESQIFASATNMVSVSGTEEESFYAYNHLLV